MPSTLVSPSGQKPLSEAAKQFRYDLLTGLNAPTQAIPSKYFYDQRGSALFDQICELQEYYPTRTEAAIMRRHAPMMAACIGDNARLVEYGSGSSLSRSQGRRGRCALDACRCEQSRRRTGLPLCSV